MRLQNWSSTTMLLARRRVCGEQPAHAHDTPIDCEAMTPDAEQPLAYSIDADDRVVDVSAAWDAFASSHGGGHLHSADIVGQPLWLLAPESAPFYEPLVARVRERGQSVAFPFRCDTPDRRRLLRMTIGPGDDGLVHFTTIVLEVQRRPAIRLDTAANRPGGPILTMCSWCKRVGSDAGWVEIEDAVSQFALAGGAYPAVTHGICAECLSRLELLLAGLDDPQRPIRLPPDSGNEE